MCHDTDRKMVRRLRTVPTRSVQSQAKRNASDSASQSMWCAFVSKIGGSSVPFQTADLEGAVVSGAQLRDRSYYASSRWILSPRC